jgi:hypothetical protein
VLHMIAPVADPGLQRACHGQGPPPPPPPGAGAIAVPVFRPSADARADHPGVPCSLRLLPPPTSRVRGGATSTSALPRDGGQGPWTSSEGAERPQQGSVELLRPGSAGKLRPAERQTQAERHSGCPDSPSWTRLHTPAPMAGPAAACPGGPVGRRLEPGGCPRASVSR